MPGLGWLFVGIGTGILHGALLWRTVSALRPEKTAAILILVWGGALLRTVTVAVLLLVALNQAFSLGLWALAGFFLARLAWGGWFARHTRSI